MPEPKEGELYDDLLKKREDVEKKNALRDITIRKVATEFVDQKYTKPKKIGLRDHKRTWGNWALFRLYRFVRFVFVTLWFYYLPVIVMALGYLVPLWTSWSCKVNDKSGSRLIRGVCIDPMQYAESFGKL